MDTKPWYQSLTVWGVAILTMSALILPLFGKTDLAGNLQTEQTNILDVVAKVGDVIGALIAIIGRFRATTTLTS